jgi:hypothetical protein
MLTFVNVATAPHKGFVWKDETGFEVRGMNFNVVLEKVKERLISRGLSVGSGWQDQVIHDMCLLTKGDCVDKSVVVREISWNDFEQFSHVFTRFIESGGQLVDVEEAERRASICVSCPKNVPLKGICGVCAGLMTWSVKLAGGLKTSHDENLFACGVCGCSNRLSVFAPIEILKDDRFVPEAFPLRCWKRPTENNN